MLRWVAMRCRHGWLSAVLLEMVAPTEPRTVHSGTLRWIYTRHSAHTEQHGTTHNPPHTTHTHNTGWAHLAIIGHCVVTVVCYVARDHISRLQRLLPPAEWCPVPASWTEQLRGWPRWRAAHAGVLPTASTLLCPPPPPALLEEEKAVAEAVEEPTPNSFTHRLVQGNDYVPLVSNLKFSNITSSKGWPPNKSADTASAVLLEHLLK